MFPMKLLLIRAICKNLHDGNLVFDSRSFEGSEADVDARELPLTVVALYD
jgi:hypothetical protein